MVGSHHVRITMMLCLINYYWSRSHLHQILYCLVWLFPDTVASSPWHIIFLCGLVKSGLPEGLIKTTSGMSGTDNGMSVPRVNLVSQDRLCFISQHAIHLEKLWHSFGKCTWRETLYLLPYSLFQVKSLGRPTVLEQSRRALS